MTPAELLRDYARLGTAQSSPLMTALLLGAADDLEAGGPAAAVLAPFSEEPPGAAVPLRFAAALHRLVLERRAPLLATHYATVGGTAPVDHVWATARAVCAAEADSVRSYTALPCQTNEVARSVALVRALAELGEVDVRVLEVGSSAGLQLLFDGFDYGTWGTPGSPCVLPAPAKVPTVRVRTAQGCDPNPVDPSTVEGRMRLTSSVWGDQVDRFQRLKGALAVAERHGRPPVDRQQAGVWLEQRLAEPFDGETVVWHSIVRQYLDPDEWTRVEALAGTVRHVSYEPSAAAFEVYELRLDGRLLATGDGHGGHLTEA